MSAAEALSLLPDLAARVLAGAAGQVICLEAPERLRTPDALRRPDGRSIYTPHDAAQYATQAQLTLEQRLTAQAQAVAIVTTKTSRNMNTERCQIMRRQRGR